MGLSGWSNLSGEPLTPTSLSLSLKAGQKSQRFFESSSQRVCEMWKLSAEKKREDLFSTQSFIKSPCFKYVPQSSTVSSDFHLQETFYPSQSIELLFSATAEEGQPATCFFLTFPSWFRFQLFPVCQGI